MLAVALGACSTQPPVSSLDAREILERAIEAQDGHRPPAGTVRSEYRVALYTTEEKDAPPLTGQLRVIHGEDEKERLELETIDGRSLLQIFDGQVGAEWENGIASRRDLLPEVRRRAVYRNLLREMLREDRGPAARVAEIVGSPTDREVVVERLIAGDLWRVFIEEDSSLLKRILCSFEGEGGRVVQEDYLSDYRRVGERLLPGRQVTVRNGRKIKEATLEDRRENIEVPPDFFELPDGG